MKRFLYLIIIFCLLSCSSDEQQRFVIGLSQPCEDAWRMRMNEEMHRELLFHPNITLEIRNSEYDNDQQCRDLDYFVEKGVDLIVVCPNEADALTPAVSRAYKSGVPVIVADRSVIGEDFTAFIAGDNLQVSRLLGEYVRNALPKGGKIIEFKGLEDASPAKMRHEEFAEIVEATEGLELVASIHADWQWDIAAQLMDSLLKAGVEADMVVAQNDQMAQGAREAADKQFPDGHNIRFIGVDAMPGEGNGINAILDGRLEASFLYPSGGEEIIRLAVKILNGEGFERNIILPSALIDKHNAEVMKMQSIQMDNEVRTIEMLKGRVDYFWQQHNLERTFLYTLLILLGVIIVFIGYLLRMYNFKQRANERLDRQKKSLREANARLRDVTKQLEEATKAKLMFFTNVSHDFRTPLTLISAPLEKLSENKDLDNQQKQLLQLAQKNVHVLLRLVNQVLDFRKYESGKLELNLSYLDLRESLKSWYDSFKSLACKKHIKLELQGNEEATLGEKSFLTQVDANKIERVFFNIIGNAFKFTPENGTIKVCLERQPETIVLSITDSGDGIQVEHIQHIFENFYQINSANHEGSGIGLAVVKSFVEMHGGTISADNVKEGNGAVFTITLPVAMNVSEVVETEKPEAKISSEKVLTELGDIESIEEIAEDEPLPVALVIDDNQDVREMMLTLLSDKYKVITAANGQEGLRKAMKIVPDVIVCDVMMPVMDGLECCRRLKTELCTSHIPVMMLTACSLDEQRVQGHREGADAYLPKPFSAEVLIAQLDALVGNHNRVRDFFADVTHLGKKEPAAGASPTKEETKEQKPIETIDETFLRKLRTLIEKNMSDSEFGVEQLGDDIGMSRAQLYRKVKALTNYSPVELIRNSRLKKGRQLIAQGSMTIAQVAYEVGFTAPSYFTKCYKEYFGEMPNELLK